MCRGTGTGNNTAERQTYNQSKPPPQCRNKGGAPCAHTLHKLSRSAALKQKQVQSDRTWATTIVHSECGLYSVRITAYRSAARPQAVPLAESQGLRIRVDESISEDRQSSGPFRMRNTAGSTTEWARVLALWDPEYSAPPIQTPEGHEQYWTRIERAVQALAERIPPASGNAALFTHATPALSLGYGLCRNLFASLQDFVEQQPIGIAACGIVHVVRDGRTGFCKELHPVDNSAFQALECGRTTYSLKRYSARPGKYWRPPELAMQKELEGAYGSEE